MKKIDVIKLQERKAIYWNMFSWNMKEAEFKDGDSIDSIKGYLIFVNSKN